MNKNLLFDRNTRNHSTVCKLFVLDRNTWYHITVSKLFIFDRNIWCHITMCKLFVLDRNTWYHITMSKLFVFDRNIWYHIIIIIMSCRQHGYPWPSLAGLQGYIPYPHIDAVCMFELVVLLLLGHMWGSIEVHHLWARPCFSSCVLHVWFV